METRTAYCSACDRPVPVMLDPAAEDGVRFSAEDATRVICLDYGVRCTGALCPLFSVRDVPPLGRSGVFPPASEAGGSGGVPAARPDRPRRPRVPDPDRPQPTA